MATVKQADLCGLLSIAASFLLLAAQVPQKAHSMDGVSVIRIHDTSPQPTLSDEKLLDDVERTHFNYFVNNQNPKTGLILDRSSQTSPCSIAAVGFALTAYPVAVQRGWVTRQDAAAWTLKVLKTLLAVPQGAKRSGTSGYHGFFYHMLDPDTGERATSPKYWNSELSSIDTALLMYGVMFARDYYINNEDQEPKIRSIAQTLLDNVEWDWIATADGDIHHAWFPETGMSSTCYHGYSEAIMMYILALGSTTHKLPAVTWKTFMGDSALYSSGDLSWIACPGNPLFTYQYPHCWLDFRDIRDDVGRKFGLDYFENSKRATVAQYKYVLANPQKYRGYGVDAWGLTACDGPGNNQREIDGIKRDFYGYCARGCPDGLNPDGRDDGTIAPTAAISSMPFTPELSLALLRNWWTNRQELIGRNGFADAFNPTFDKSSRSGWIAPDTIGIDQGPIVLMLENYRSGLIWKTMKNDPTLRIGLQRATFSGGWLDTTSSKQ